MAMYFMSGKTFLTQYIDEDPKKVLRTQFILVSLTIRKSKSKYEKQIINASNMLFPMDDLIVDYDDYKHDENYREEYFETLEKHKAFFATLIKGVIEDNYTIVFLCGEREKRYRYFNMIQEYLDKKFGFPIYNYKKYKENKEKVKSFNASLVLEKCEKILKHAKKEKQQKAFSGSNELKERYLSSLSKKELKKELKKRMLYIDDMSREEMIDMLHTFT